VGVVTFRWKDYAHGSKQKLMTVTADEFLRRFLLHVLPHGFVRIRFFGFFANRRRKTLLPLCHELLLMASPRGFTSRTPSLFSRCMAMPALRRLHAPDAAPVRCGTPVALSATKDSH
jgi:hypothetical protein